MAMSGILNSSSETDDTLHQIWCHKGKNQRKIAKKQGNWAKKQNQTGVTPFEAMSAKVGQWRH